MLNNMAELCKGDRKSQLRMSAQIQKDMYDTYVEVGFNPQQALEMTKAFTMATILRIPSDGRS